MNLTVPDQSTIASMNNVDWAWEFLRRNPEYKQDYRLSLSLQAGCGAFE